MQFLKNHSFLLLKKMLVEISKICSSRYTRKSKLVQRIQKLRHISLTFAIYTCTGKFFLLHCFPYIPYVSYFDSFKSSSIPKRITYLEKKMIKIHNCHVYFKWFVIWSTINFFQCHFSLNNNKMNLIWFCAVILCIGRLTIVVKSVLSVVSFAIVALIVMLMGKLNSTRKKEIQYVFFSKETGSKYHK